MGNHRSGVVRQLLLSVAGAVLLLTSARSADAPLPEYTVKAALLLKLARFVTWPTAAESRQDFGVCVLGQDPFRDALESLQSQRVHGRAVRVLRLTTPEQGVENCDLLFTTEQDSIRLSQYFSQLDRRAILTVGDAAGFARTGGMLGMVTRNRKVGFEINLQPSQRSGLEFNSQLLQLATVIGSGRDGGRK
jgi:hypothetical protein